MIKATYNRTIFEKRIPMLASCSILAQILIIIIFRHFLEFKKFEFTNDTYTLISASILPMFFFFISVWAQYFIWQFSFYNLDLDIKFYLIRGYDRSTVNALLLKNIKRNLRIALKISLVPLILYHAYSTWIIYEMLNINAYNFDIFINQIMFVLILLLPLCMIAGSFISCTIMKDPINKVYQTHIKQKRGMTTITFGSLYIMPMMIIFINFHHKETFYTLYSNINISSLFCLILSLALLLFIQFMQSTLKNSKIAIQSYGAKSERSQNKKKNRTKAKLAIMIALLLCIPLQFPQIQKLRLSLIFIPDLSFFIIVFIFFNYLNPLIQKSNFESLLLFNKITIFGSLISILIAQFYLFSYFNISYFGQLIFSFLFFFSSHTKTFFLIKKLNLNYFILALGILSLLVNNLDFGVPSHYNPTRDSSTRTLLMQVQYGVLISIGLFSMTLISVIHYYSYLSFSTKGHSFRVLLQIHFLKFTLSSSILLPFIHLILNTTFPKASFSHLQSVFIFTAILSICFAFIHFYFLLSIKGCWVKLFPSITIILPILLTIFISFQIKNIILLCSLLSLSALYLYLIYSQNFTLKKLIKNCLLIGIPLLISNPLTNVQNFLIAIFFTQALYLFRFSKSNKHSDNLLSLSILMIALTTNLILGCIKNDFSCFLYLTNVLFFSYSFINKYFTLIKLKRLPEQDWRQLLIGKPINKN